MKDLQTLIDDVERHCHEGNRKALSEPLREVMRNRRRYYSDSLANHLSDPFSDMLFKALLLELDEEEVDSIEMAEMAYVSLTHHINSLTDASAEHYKRRLLLLHYFADYFTDAIVEIFLKRYQKDNRIEARNLALDCLDRMQTADMLWLDDHFPGFIENDEQATDACSTLKTNPNMNEAEREEALLLHKVLHAFLKAKYNPSKT